VWECQGCEGGSDANHVNPRSRHVPKFHDVLEQYQVMSISPVTLPSFADISRVSGRLLAAFLFGVCRFRICRPGTLLVDPNVNARMHSMLYDCFIDVAYAPQTLSAGRLRLLVAGTQVRFFTDVTKNVLVKMVALAMVDAGEMVDVSTSWKVFVLGFHFVTTEAKVRVMANHWAKVCAEDMPTLHIYTKARVCNICVSTGVVVRPLFVNPTKLMCAETGPFVDNITMNHSDTMEFLGLRKPNREDDPMQFMCIQMWMIPGCLSDMEPRPALAIFQMLKQGLSAYPVWTRSATPNQACPSSSGSLIISKVLPCRIQCICRLIQWGLEDRGTGSQEVRSASVHRHHSGFGVPQSAVAQGKGNGSCYANFLILTRHASMFHGPV